MESIDNMSLEELRNAGIKAGVFIMEKDGSCVISHSFNRFYEKHRKQHAELSSVFQLWLINKTEQMKAKFTKEKVAKINITELVFEFILTRWLEQNKISLIDDEFNLVIKSLFRALE